MWGSRSKTNPEDNSWHQTTLAESASGWTDEVLQSNINRFKKHVDRPLGQYDQFVQDTLMVEQSRRDEATQESKSLIGRLLHR